MPRHHFNWKLFAVLVIGIVVIGFTAVVVRQWQRDRRVEESIAAGNEAYAEGDWEDAASWLGRYIAIVQDDPNALLKYADAQLRIRPLTNGHIEQAVAAYRTALRLLPDNLQAAERLTEIYLEFDMPEEAQFVASRYLSDNDSVKLRKMLAEALTRQKKFDEASLLLESL